MHLVLPPGRFAAHWPRAADLDSSGDQHGIALHVALVVAHLEWCITSGWTVFRSRNDVV